MLLGSEHALVKSAYQEALGSQGHSVAMQAMVRIVLGWEGVGGLNSRCARVEGLRAGAT